MNQLIPISPNLNQCDLEPVALIESIQPFGMVLIIDSSNFIVQQASQNSLEIIGADLNSILGKPAHHIFDESVIQKIKKKEELIFFNNKIIFVHQYENYLILDIEPETQEAKLHEWNCIQANQIIDHLHSSETMLDLCRSAAKEIYKITGFDRIMIYKFHEDYHGEVIIEIRNQKVDSYLGLHYPASDIPTAARLIYQNTWIRMIPNVEYEPVLLISKTPLENRKAVDLTESILRAVSPIHIQYLKNMKVHATLTIALRFNGKLWGLIACHHLTPKTIAYEDRTTCELIGKLTSALLREKSIQELEREKSAFKEVYRSLFDQMEQSENIEEALIKNPIFVKTLIKSSGIAAALYFEGKWTSVGNVPTSEQLERLINWLTKNHGNKEVFYTESLPTIYPEALAFKEIGCGLLAISIPKSRRLYILCFRPEVIETVTWAGNPDKSVHFDGNELRPRSSFEAWKTSVALKSIPWKAGEISVALDLRNSIIALDLSRQFTKVQKAQTEIKAREDVMAILSHDLKNPLSTIELNLGLIAKFYPLDSIPQVKGPLENINRAKKVMKKMIEDILDVTRIEAGSLPIEKMQVEPGALVGEVLEFLSSMSTEKNIELLKTTPNGEYSVLCDRNRIFQVLSNLVSNAIKFTPENGKITVSFNLCEPNLVEFCVTDTGSGISEENLSHLFDRFWQARETHRFGTGLGLSIVKGIVQAHGGSVWVKSKAGQGSRFFFTLPRSDRALTIAA